MMKYMNTTIRALVIAVVLAFTVQVAQASRPADSISATARTTSEPTTTGREEAPLDGLLILAGIVGVVILLAWAASRVGDRRGGHLMG
jgi:Mn2+/Fe2+ NRAMP family transporter